VNGAGVLGMKGPSGPHGDPGDSVPVEAFQTHLPSAVELDPAESASQSAGHLL
jgi:hypothetical protein